MESAEDDAGPGGICAEGFVVCICMILLVAVLCILIALLLVIVLLPIEVPVGFGVLTWQARARARWAAARIRSSHVPAPARKCAAASPPRGTLAPACASRSHCKPLRAPPARATRRTCASAQRFRSAVPHLNRSSLLPHIPAAALGGLSASCGPQIASACCHRRCAHAALGCGA